MLATLGSIASQGGGFKGVVWNFGTNIFNLNFIKDPQAGMTVDVDYEGYYRISTISLQDVYCLYYLDLTLLQIKGGKIIVHIKGSSSSGNTYFRVLYTDGTYDTVSNSGTVIIRQADLNPSKILKGIAAVALSTDRNSHFSRIGYIEII